jgi:plasmid stability protein
MVARMATITLKDIPEDVHAQLKAEAEANLRSLNQEAIIRLQRSFDTQDRISTERVNQLIDEALASGPEEPFTRVKFEQARYRARTQAAADRKVS